MFALIAIISGLLITGVVQRSQSVHAAGNQFTRQIPSAGTTSFTSTPDGTTDPAWPEFAGATDNNPGPAAYNGSMALPLFRTKTYVFVSLVFLLILGLAACGTDSVAGTTPTTSTTPPGGATATATVTALIKQMTLVGTPTAKIVSGTTFEVDGKMKNRDDKQHDIFL
jgi:hypothetical protein